MDGLEIRLWQPDDRPALLGLVHEYLEQAANGEADFLPDKHNVEALVDLGTTWAQAGEPCFVAVVKGEIVGFALAGPVTSALHLREKVLHAIGVYVVEKHRRDRVSFALQEKGSELAFSRGYDRIDSTILDQRSWLATKTAGFEIVGYIVRKRAPKSKKRAA